MKKVSFIYKGKTYQVSYNDATTRLEVVVPNYREGYQRAASFPLEEKLVHVTRLAVLELFGKVLTRALNGINYSNYDLFAEMFRASEEEPVEETLRKYDLAQECRIGFEYFRTRNHDAEDIVRGLNSFVADLIGSLKVAADEDADATAA